MMPVAGLSQVNTTLIIVIDKTQPRIVTVTVESDTQYLLVCEGKVL